MPEREIYEFGSFRLDVAEHSLSQAGRAVSLKPKVFDTLVLLVRNAGHLLPKQELMSRLWPDSVVDETNLNRNVWLIRRALSGSGDSPDYIETVPRIGYRFVGDVRRIEITPPALSVPAAPAVVPQPAPPRAVEGAPAVSAQAEQPPAQEASAPARRIHRGAIAAAIAGVAVLVAGALALRSPKHSPPPAARADSRPTISVLGFRNLSGRPDLDWIATALSEMVQTELAPGSAYRLMPVETAERLRRDLSLERPGSLSAESLERLRRAAAVDRVIGGSYVSSGSGPSESRIRIDVLVQDARTGETVGSASETGEPARLFDLVASIGARLRASLREPERTPEASEAALLPRDPTALRLYSEGLRKLRNSDALAARDLLVEAVAAEPGFALSHAALGRAHATLGYEEQARLELQQAFDASRGLPRKEQLEIESAYRAASKEWDRAIELCRELQRLAPDDLENGLRLASLQFNASRHSDALATIRGLRALPPPAGNDPRVDLLESRVLMPTDSKSALKAAERGLAEARSRQERSIEADALVDRSVAMQTLGRSEKAPLEQAIRIFSEVGDPGGEARAAHKLGDVQFDEGDASGARASYQHAAEVSDRIGYVLEKAAAVASLSRVATLRGDPVEAEKLIVEANSIWRAVPDRRQLPWGLNALGDIRLGQGKLDDAIALHREAMKISRENGSYLHDSYSGLIASLAAQGKLEEASALAEQALKNSREKGEQSWIAQHALELGALELERGRLPEAGRLLGESLEIREKLREYTVPESEIPIARLRLEEGKWEEARRLAEKAAGEFAAAGRKPDQAGADAVAAEALLAGGRREDAKKSADAARALLDETTSADARIPVLLAAARVENALGRPQAARTDVDAAAALARKIGWKDLILETRLAAAEIGAAGFAAAGGPRRQASSLAADARAMGFERIAKRADRLGPSVR